MFITFEGPEGAGKSSVINALSERMKSADLPVITTREPGAGNFGKEVRNLILEQNNIPALSELFLFLADRANHIERIVKPALAEGVHVLCDRHAESTLVYQGYARGLDVAKLRKLNLLATQNLRPHLIFLLDLPVEVGLERVTDVNRLDREPIAFHQKVRAGFLSELGREPSLWHQVDATQPLNTVVDECAEVLSERIGKSF